MDELEQLDHPVGKLDRGGLIITTEMMWIHREVHVYTSVVLKARISF